MKIKARDVILIPDETVDPPKPKFVVCAEPDLGFFFRINSKMWRPCVLMKLSDHPFMDHDSYIEAGDPLELDDYIVSESIAKKGIFGFISDEVALKIVQFLVFANSTKETDKQAITKALSPAATPSSSAPDKDS